ncbi:MAG: acyltransferase [Alistipes sp.]|nr:acyltransferase [Alistipes sp.]
MKSCRITSNEESALLAIFSFLRFPLIVLVVLCHSFMDSVMGNAEVACFANTSFVLSRVIANVAVPCYLLISGYLFFRNIESFTLRQYGEKLQRRVGSILVPYLFWNGVVILLFFVGQTIVPELFSGNNTRVCDYTLLDWVKAFWRVDGTMSPINAPLWFVRNLMVAVVLSPLLFWLLKNRVVGAIFNVTMLALWLFVPSIEREVVWLQPKFYFFFSLGAWFALHKVKVPKFRPAAIVIAGVLFVLAVTAIFFRRGRVGVLFYESALLIGSLLLMYGTYHIVKAKGWTVPAWLSQSYFFIFVYHYIPLALLQRVAVKFLKPTTNVEYFVIYFASFAVIVLLGVGLFHLLKRLFPKFTAFILGSRA